MIPDEPGDGEADAMLEATAPEATAELPRLYLKRQEDRRIAAGHLWIFSNEVDVARSPLTRFAPGEVVAVHSDRERFLGWAYVNPRSLIAARILGRDAQHAPSKSLFVHRLQVALDACAPADLMHIPRQRRPPERVPRTLDADQFAQVLAAIDLDGFVGVRDLTIIRTLY